MKFPSSPPADTYSIRLEAGQKIVLVNSVALWEFFFFFLLPCGCFISLTLVSINQLEIKAQRETGSVAVFKNKLPSKLPFVHLQHKMVTNIKQT